jgi:hypothetical protein
MTGLIKGLMSKREILAKLESIDSDLDLTIRERSVTTHGETIFRIESPSYDRLYSAVAQWFGEAPHRAPFPKGTLLHFSDIEGATARLIPGSI